MESGLFFSRGGDAERRAELKDAEACTLPANSGADPGARAHMFTARAPPVEAAGSRTEDRHAPESHSVHSGYRRGALSLLRALGTGFVVLYPGVIRRGLYTSRVRLRRCSTSPRRARTVLCFVRVSARKTNSPTGRKKKEKKSSSPVGSRGVRVSGLHLAHFG